LIYLWLKYARDFTLERTQDGGNLELGRAAQLGSKALQRSMSTMEVELPNILYATQFNTSFLNTQTNCSTFYYNTLNFTPQVAASLCNSNPTNLTLNSSVFDFSDVFRTSYALVNIFLMNDTVNMVYPMGNTSYANLFMKITGLNFDQMNQTIFKDGVFSHFMKNAVYTPIYQHYNSTVCAGNPTNASCSNRQIVHNQWAFGSVLTNPLPTMNISTNVTANITSYTRVFPNYTTLITFTPELAFYTHMANLTALKININDVFMFLNSTKLYNLKVYDDVLLGTLPAASPWNVDTMKRYLRFVIIESALNGLFQFRTPREYLEGFNDPLIEDMSMQPVYMGGDSTNPSFMSCNSPPTILNKQQVSFFSGDDDYMFTRRIA
jgi:hypothetical protein